MPAAHSAGSIRLGVCSWSLRPENSRDLVEKTVRTGIRGVQLALTPLVERPAEFADSAERLRGAGVAILSGMLETVGEDYSTIARIAETGGVRPDATWPATRSRAAAVARLAGELGLPLVTFHAGFLPHDRRDPERSVMLARLREVIDLFADRGVAVAFETGQEPADTLADCLEELARPSVGVNFDPANMILYGAGDPVAAIRRLAPWVRQVHVKDALPAATPGTWGSEVPAGEGAVDWTGFLTAVRGLPRPVDLVIEREAGDRREEDVRTAATLLARHGISHA
jgi:sugar phosphate isomerase/epimerase